MGACLSTPTLDAGSDARFRGLYFTDAQRRRARAYIESMDAVARLHRTHVGLLGGIHAGGTWDIYLHFSNWDRPVTDAIVASLVAAYRSACRAWLAHLRGHDGFRRGRVRVRVFGFVFQQGVVLDPSFLRGRYRHHPRVVDWPADTEPSPWRVVRHDREWKQANYYEPSLDLHSLEVVGNRTDVRGATFHPESWEHYLHPEGCRGYQTKYWNGTTPQKAFAQRHYLRVSGVADPATGRFDARGFQTLLHEMGHCFFLDDMYARSKYPVPLAECNCSLQPGDTVMHSAIGLTPMDHAMLRHVWSAQRARQGGAPKGRPR